MIMPGVKIGEGAIVAANSVVTKDVAPYSIVAGSPAQLVKYRFDAKVIDELLALKVYDWPPENLRRSNRTYAHWIWRHSSKRSSNMMPSRITH